MALFEVRGLKKSFGDHVVLDGIDLDIEDGEFLTIIGESGSGKSVLLKHVMGLMVPDRGSVKFRGEVVAGEKAFAELRRNVGMLFQTTDNDVVPFFVASAGITRLDPDVPGADSEERFSMSLGGGVKILFNDHFGLRLEGRGYFTLIDDYDSGCYDDDFCCDCGYYDSGTSLSQGEASVGMIFAW